MPELLRISFNIVISNIDDGQQLSDCKWIIDALRNKPAIANNIQKSILPLWLAIEALPQIEIIEFLQDALYSETIRIDDPGCYAKTALYDAEAHTLNVKKGIREIIQWKYQMIIHNMDADIITPQHKEHFLDLLDKYAALFDITYSKEPWETIYG